MLHKVNNYLDYRRLDVAVLNGNQSINFNDKSWDVCTEMSIKIDLYPTLDM